MLRRKTERKITFDMRGKNMIDYTEIPYDSDLWELFARDFLTEFGFHIETPPDRGPDAGKDLLVIVDSITPMLTLLDSQKAFHFLHTMKYITRASRAIGIAIIDLGIYDTKLEESCKQIADTIIELKSIGKEHINGRLIRIIKNIDSYFDQPYPFEIVKNLGFVVHKLFMPYLEC